MYIQTFRPRVYLSKTEMSLKQSVSFITSYKLLNRMNCISCSVSPFARVPHCLPEVWPCDPLPIEVDILFQLSDLSDPRR